MASFSQNKLTLPKAKRIPYVNYLDWAPPMPLSALSTGRTSQHSAGPGATDWMLNLDFTCFILGTHEITLERAHLLNAVRSDRTLASQVVRKLQEMRIVTLDGFSLDHESNFIALDRGMHTKLDLYNIYAITGSLETLQGLFEHVKKVNADWQRLVDQQGPQPLPYPRFDGLVPSISNPEFQVVVLHPGHMIRDKLWFGGRPEAEVPSGIAFMQDGRLKIRADDGTISDYPAFHHHSHRLGDVQVNIFLVLINAHSKFERHLAKFGVLPSALDQELSNLTIKIVDALYFVPHPAPGSRGEAIKNEKERQKAQAARVTADTPLRSDDRKLRSSSNKGEGGEGGGQGGQIQLEANHLSPTTNPGSDSPMTFEEDNDSQDMFSVSPSSQPDELGLSNEEIEILGARMSDPNLSVKERAQAGMLLFFGNNSPLPLPDLPGQPAPKPLNGLDAIKAQFG